MSKSKPTATASTLGAMAIGSSALIPSGCRVRFAFRIGATVFVRPLPCGDLIALSADTPVTDVRELVIVARDSAPVADPADPRAAR